MCLDEKLFINTNRTKELIFLHLLFIIKNFLSKSKVAHFIFPGILFDRIIILQEDLFFSRKNSIALDGCSFGASTFISCAPNFIFSSFILSYHSTDLHRILQLKNYYRLTKGKYLLLIVFLEKVIEKSIRTFCFV